MSSTHTIKKKWDPLTCGPHMSSSLSFPSSSSLPLSLPRSLFSPCPERWWGAAPAAVGSGVGNSGRERQRPGCSTAAASAPSSSSHKTSTPWSSCMSSKKSPSKKLTKSPGALDGNPPRLAPTRIRLASPPLPPAPPPGRRRRSASRPHRRAVALPHG
uniref:Uncharacterized protein n=1 Tax=Oryza sativa subsp. japonica TaxID=39947 RepID=Q5Z770_ORYSJ|nr:hypothetical protein [Oryza sativa Japonica Group]